MATWRTSFDLQDYVTDLCWFRWFQADVNRGVQTATVFPLHLLYALATERQPLGDSPAVL
jgi:hypothetical protein